MGVLHDHHRMVSDSRTRGVGLEEKVKAKKKLIALDADILTWTQQMNWFGLKLEAAQAERAKPVTLNLGSVEQELDEATSTSLEHF